MKTIVLSLSRLNETATRNITLSDQFRHLPQTPNEGIFNDTYIFKHINEDRA